MKTRPLGSEYVVYARADGELIGDDYEWVDSTELFDEDEYWGPIKLVQRTMIIVKEELTTWYPTRWWENCEPCQARGFFTDEAGADEECPECSGEGQIEHERPDDHMVPRPKEG